MRLTIFLFFAAFIVLFAGCASSRVSTETLSPEIQQKVLKYNELAADYVYGEMKHRNAYRPDVKSVVTIAYGAFLKNASTKLNGYSYTSKLFQENKSNANFDYGLTITDAKIEKIESKSTDGFWHESFIYSTIVVDGKHTFKVTHETLITTDSATNETELWTCNLVDIFL